MKIAVEAVDELVADGLQESGIYAVHGFPVGAVGCLGLGGYDLAGAVGCLAVAA